MENQNDQQSGMNWGPALLLGTFVLGASFLGNTVIEIGQTLLDARKAKKKK